MLTALLLSLCLSSVSLPVAADPGAAPTPDVTAAQVAAPELAPAPDPDFAVWLVREQAKTLSTPAFELAAQCRTCSDCPPSQPFCCILASGCASCTSRPVLCAPGGLAGA